MQVSKTRHVLSRAVETLEMRRLLASPELLAIPDDQTTGDTPRAIVIYDVSDIRNATAASNPFLAKPLFSIWTGYELTEYPGATNNDRNPEDFAAFTVDNKGHFGYYLAFDSGSSGQADVGGDNIGDYDLYRLNIKAAYDDFMNPANNRAKGVMYAPRYSPDFQAGDVVGNGGIDYIATYGGTLGPTGLPSADSTNIGILASTAGGTPIRNNKDEDRSNDLVFIDGISQKVGEVVRYGAVNGTQISFNQQDLHYVNDDTLVLMEKPLAEPNTPAVPKTSDFSIRTIKRVNRAPGFAQPRENETGGTNGNTSESWESVAWTGDNFVGLDGAGDPRAVSSVDGMQYVDRDGVQGVWVSDRDGGGDDFSFFKLDFATQTATKQEFRTGASPFSRDFELDEDPETDPAGNNGDIDGFDIDANGNLVIRESGFNDTPQHEPKVITRTIASYAAGDSDGNLVGELTFGAWDTKPELAVTGANDDEGEVTAGLYAALSKAQNLYYYFDIDITAGALSNPDLYVYDVTTGQVILSVLNITNHFFREGNRLRVFTLDVAGPDTVAPTVALAYSNATEQAVTLTFSEPLATSGAGALTAADLVLRNTTTNTTIPTGDVTVTSLGGNVYKVTYKTGAASAPLAKGIYTLTVTGSGVTDAAGNPVAGTPSVQFRVLPGDANGDGNVNFDDLLILAQNYGSSGKNYAAGNFTYDAAGSVNFDDLLLLAQNYGTSLAVAAPKPVVAAKRTSSRSVASEVL